MSKSADGITRKDFIGQASGLLAAAAFKAPSRPVRASFRAVAFDGYAVFDATQTIAVAESIMPGKGREFVAAWRARMFEYQWLRTLGNRYAGFEQTASDALSYTVDVNGTNLTQSARAELLGAQTTLTPWPDAASELSRLHSAGVGLAVLSNMSEHMLDAGLQRGGLRQLFESVLSTDRVRASKPDSRAYRMGPGALGRPIQEIAFVAFAPWDVAGASWFGYRTIWLNRARAPAEKLDGAATVVCNSLAEVTNYVLDPQG
jgi:2-haloacid dehalogenase